MVKKRTKGPVLTINDMKRRKELGAWIKRLREREELTQKDAADLLGYSYFTTLSAFERGASPLPLSLWPEMARVYKVEPKVFAMRALKLEEPKVFNMLFQPEQLDEQEP